MIKELRARYAALLDEGMTLLAIEKPTDENRTRIAAVMAEQRDLAGRIAQHDELDKAQGEVRARQEAEERARLAGRPALPDPGQQGEDRSLTKEQREERAGKHKDAYVRYLKTGNKEELRAMGIASGSTGGYAVPTTLSPELETAVLAYGGVIGSLGQLTTEGGGPIAFDLSNDTANYAVSIAEGQTAGEQDLALAQRNLTVDTMTTKMVMVSRQLLQDSQFDLVSYINARLAERAGRGLSKKVTGAGDSYFDSIVAQAVAGATTADPAAIALQDCYNHYKLMDPGYADNASWVMNLKTQVTLSALRNDLGAPIFQLDGSGLLKTLLGKPVVIDAGIPDIGAGNRPIIFGDLKKYTLRRAGGFEIFRQEDALIPSYQVAFVGFFRAGGILLDAGTHPIQALVQHA